jgi:MoxR-like ATPase
MVSSSDDEEFSFKWRYVSGIKYALRLFRVGGCTMIVGPPGSGKTEMVNDIVKYTKYPKIDVKLASL